MAAPTPVHPEPRPGVRRLGPATVAVVVVFGVFVALWAPVLAGRRTLVGGDVLYNFNPWTSEPAVHTPRNHAVGDPIAAFVPWLGLVRESFGDGQLPLWNPYSLSGTPLLANDQSSPFSPFTLLAVLFADPARGLSIAMLAKLWVAGLGMAAFLRAMALRPLPCLLGGISYATSAFMVVWLAYPLSSVAALLPWAFAGVEWYLRRGSLHVLAGLAAAVAAQFLAGHAETSLHLGLALAGYTLVRLGALRGRRRPIALGLMTAAAVGTLAAGIQLVPFLAQLAETSIVGDRADARAGANHLEPAAAVTWLVPNGKGNPGIDRGDGQAPNYLEATGFAGVGALVLGAVAVAERRRRRNEVLALGLLTAVSAGVVYGPLSPLAGRLPLLSVANNARFLVVAAFGVAALGALGLDALATAPSTGRGRLRPSASLALATLSLAGLGLAAVTLAREGEGTDDLLPSLFGQTGFWVLVAALGLGAAAALVAAARAGRARLAAPGFVALGLVEGLLFAFPFNPRVPPGEVPPPSEAVDWLVARADHGSVAALGLDLLPNSSVTARVHDVRGYDTLRNPRIRTYWSRADPGFIDDYFYTVLRTPRAAWLGAAGVAYVMTPNAAVIPGTRPVYQRGGITVSEVPERRPFASAAESTVTVTNAEEAADRLALDPLGPVVVERRGGAPDPQGGAAEVKVLSRGNGSVRISVDAPAASRVVVLQSFAPGWVARVDGRPATIEPANVLFQSVAVPAGRHTLVLRYRPSSVRLGVAATAVGTLGIAGLVLTSAVRARRARRAGRAATVGPA